jgi:D-glycero-D-manno-heptose 1,7-bisphosphate phosphatase
LNKAIFMDRDGTLLEENGYMYHAGLYRPFPWIGQAVRRINDAGFKAVLITNQSGVERGYFTASTVNEVHHLLQADLAESHALLDAIYYCPHKPETGCGCRKPKPGMLLQAGRDLDIDLANSFMIGDRYLDVETGRAAAVRTILVRTGDGAAEFERYRAASAIQPHFVADNLLDAVDAILGGRVR